MNRGLRKGLITIGVCYLVYMLWLNRLYARSLIPSSSSDGAAVVIQNAAAKNVPLDVHIMSKCPDAKDCLQQLVLPAMEKISDKVDFQLSFIGR